MVIMDGFDHLLNWKLKVGSHRFPGPDGGTCINEAALVAAGFEYRPVTSVEHMPKCFSRPICRLALRLNDSADDEQRQRLLPYVTRLACADTKEVELAREAYINWQLRYGFSIPFNKGLEVLEGALAIGRQADPLGPEEVRTRMDAVRIGRSKRRRASALAWPQVASAKATVPALGSDKPFFSKVKSWLTMKEIEPMA
jgi:hypothetical protein